MGQNRQNAQNDHFVRNRSFTRITTLVRNRTFVTLVTLGPVLSELRPGRPVFENDQNDQESPESPLLLRIALLRKVTESLFLALLRKGEAQESPGAQGRPCTTVVHHRDVPVPPWCITGTSLTSPV